MRFKGNMSLKCVLTIIITTFSERTWVPGSPIPWSVSLYKPDELDCMSHRGMIFNFDNRFSLVIL